jgi:hypothetical protein
MFFKGECPQAYSYAYDDLTSLFSCSDVSKYTITFCPWIIEEKKNCASFLYDQNETNNLSMNYRKEHISVSLMNNWILLYLYHVWKLNITIVIGCNGACMEFNQPQYCCTGDYSTSTTCPPTNYSMFFKKECPHAYSYACDDPTSLFSYSGGSNYSITFCPWIIGIFFFFSFLFF